MNDNIKNEKGKIFLFGLHGFFAGKKILIRDKVVFGRDPIYCNMIFPPDMAGISSVHCEITIAGKTPVITDFGSTFGTYVNEDTKLPANRPTVLRNGECFWVGTRDHMFKIVY